MAPVVPFDSDGSEWVIIGVTHTGLSRIRRDSLAHQVHSEGSSEIAKSLKEN